jgi:hypothetical protein
VIHRSMMNMMMLTSQLADRDHTLAFHQAIFEAIRRHDGAEAERLRMSIRKNTARKRLSAKASRYAVLSIGNSNPRVAAHIAWKCL